MNKMIQYQGILQNPRNQWNYFQCSCIDKRRSGDISLQTRLYTFRSFSLLINSETYYSFKPLFLDFSSVFFYFLSFHNGRCISQQLETIYIFYNVTYISVSCCMYDITLINTPHKGKLRENCTCILK